MDPGVDLNSGGIVAGFSQDVEVCQENVISIIPDTAFEQICETNCAECAQACEEAAGHQLKTRTFNICGSISVEEEVCFAEREKSQEHSSAVSAKDSVCLTGNANNVGTGDPCGCGCGDGLQVSL